MDMHFFGVPMTSVNKAFFIICIILTALVFILKLHCYLLIQCHRRKQHPNNRLPQHISQRSSPNHLHQSPQVPTILHYPPIPITWTPRHRGQPRPSNRERAIPLQEFPLMESMCGKVDDMQEVWYAEGAHLLRCWHMREQRLRAYSCAYSYVGTLTNYYLTCIYKGPNPEGKSLALIS